MNNKTTFASDDIILKLNVLAKEKEDVRKKLVITAEKLKLKAEQIAITAKEKEAVRKKLVITAEELKISRQTLEQKVLERTQELEQARAKDRAILASIGDGMVVVDKEGRITYVNQAFEKILGWKMQEILNKRAVEIIPRKDKNGKAVLSKERILTQVLLGKKVTADLSKPFYYIRKNKNRFPATSTVSPIILDRKIVGAVGTFRDITKEKEIEETKEKQLQHEIEIETKERDFISMASHQLLTPLTLMKGYTSMLISGKIGKIDQEAKKYLQESLQGSDRMSNLVKSLLTTSRIESENIKVVKVNFDLNELIRSIAIGLKPTLEAKKLAIKVPIPKKFMVFADKNQTREILMNVLDNAIKYSETGTITISENQTDCLGTISIKDTGVGINQKDLPHIFEKFYASENWLQKQSESHGLGLYIAKLFLKSMDGSIRAESKIGKGSTFFISLPLTQNG